MRNLILSYLWGIETITITWYVNNYFIGFYLTYEELKQWSIVQAWCFPIWFYLTYEELKHLFYFQASPHFLRFYLTYEELKHYQYTTTDPENNGILSYLWGIETYVYSGFFSVAFIGFYLTYEELKRIFFFHLRIWLVWFYLTYEELKHSKSTEKRENLKGFYLTYEELKLNSVPIFITALSDFILPMRNWNLFQIAFACLQGRLDFILPMRNWNFIAFLFAIFLFIGFYLTYEELKPFKICDNFSIVIRILSYLWGIET